MNAILIGAALAVALGANAEARPKPEERPLAAKAGEQVRLQFAWPTGLRGRCTQRFTRKASGPETTVESAYVLRWEAAGDRIRVIEEDVAPPKASGPFASIADGIDPGTTTRVVERSGRFAAVENLDRVVERVMSLTRPSSPAAATPEMSAALRRAIEIRSRDAWAMMVGFWVGGDLVVGETAEWDIPGTGGAAPGLGSATVEAVFACPSGPKGRRCARIVWTQRWSEPPSTTARARALIGASAPGTPAPALGATAHEERGVLVTEPATLVPHRNERTRVSRTEVTLPSGERATAELRKTWAASCSYERAPAK